MVALKDLILWYKERKLRMGWEESTQAGSREIRSTEEEQEQEQEDDDDDDDNDEEAF